MYFLHPPFFFGTNWHIPSFYRSYKAKAFISFRLLGEKGPKLSGKEKEVSSKMLNEFKAGMMRSGGRFIKCASATRSKKRYYAVNDADALRSKKT